MPLYTISTPAPLTAQTRERLARAVVDIHCGLTAAPPTFVNVMFSHGLPIRRHLQAHMLANVRKGRSASTNSELREQMAQSLSEILAIESAAVEVAMLEVPARWVMEGGVVLPEPGEEADSKWGGEVAPHPDQYQPAAAAGE
ncbi:MAG: tautomerase family protein [Halioglobus sp.]|nr:tautomerase family protein [Halioglobus sp.]